MGQPRGPSEECSTPGRGRKPYWVLTGWVRHASPENSLLTSWAFTSRAAVKVVTSLQCRGHGLEVMALTELESTKSGCPLCQQAGVPFPCCKLFPLSPGHVP